MEDEDFLEGMEQANRSEVTEAVEAPAAEAVAEPEVQEPVEQPVVETPKPEAQHVPITALLDERDKRRNLEQEIERLRAAQTPPQQAQMPDMFEDPEGYTAYQHSAHQQAMLNSKLDISEEMARDKFGDEKVNAARDWALQAFATRPGFQQEVLGQRHPWKYAVEQFEREQIVKQVTPDDFAQFQAWKQAQAQVQPAPQNQRQAPPRSLASAPSAGGIMSEVIPTESEIFADTFDRK